MIKSIKHRLDVWKEEPLYWEQIAAIDKRLNASSVPGALRELIKVRVSQINKCVFCIEYHTQEALQQGESSRRIFALSAWEESPLFSESEKSAIRFAEEITHISVHGVSDKTYEKLKAHFNTKEIADLIVLACHINFLNRVGISTKTIPVKSSGRFP
ncbi:carboxymuconolactone decarboxylase family protein [Chitinophaga filiformis]|uniref:carboxymuconolactone decarboxylase family protein n=1 Tax=Chitinophaga filiformis TaxID=104663 RepID=UPI001F347CF2|nr:carboxymuconolactone decarboxylase family protein [Chitinophaga filiformis]MCF6404619.1 carboxymuconolactone decarboxylase family protein [Chitinophaga filiformis]